MIMTFIFLLVYALSYWVSKVVHDAVVGALDSRLDKVLRVIAISILAGFFTAGLLGLLGLVFPNFFGLAS